MVGWMVELGLRQPRRQLTDDAHQLLHSRHAGIELAMGLPAGARHLPGRTCGSTTGTPRVWWGSRGWQKGNIARFRHWWYSRYDHIPSSQKHKIYLLLFFFLDRQKHRQTSRNRDGLTLPQSRGRGRSLSRVHLSVLLPLSLSLSLSTFNSCKSYQIQMSPSQWKEENDDTIYLPPCRTDGGCDCHSSTLRLWRL